MADRVSFKVDRFSGSIVQFLVLTGSGEKPAAEGGIRFAGN